MTKTSLFANLITRTEFRGDKISTEIIQYLRKGEKVQHNTGCKLVIIICICKFNLREVCAIEQDNAACHSASSQNKKDFKSYFVT